MSGEAVYATTPVGRFVMGDAFTGDDKDMQGRPRTDQQGKPKVQWFIAMAIAKNDPGWPELWAAIAGVAQRDFPRGDFNRPDFAWKVADGDTKYPDRPECRGCWVVRLSSGFAPTVYNASNAQITEIKRGDYIRCYVSMKGNDDQQKPGVYLNHQMVQLVGYGEAITSGPSAAQAFGAPAALPPGASATPVASAPMPALPTQGAPLPGAPVPPATGFAPPPLPAGTLPGVPQAPTVFPSSYPSILNGPTG